MGYRWILAPILLGCVIATRPVAADDDAPSGFGLDLKGYIEGRLVMTDHERSWQDGGLGKVRYGGDAGGGTRTGARAEGALIVQPQFGFDVTGNVVLAFNSQQRTAVDVIEAFLQYKPAPTGPVGVRGKVGAFFPPISLENTGLAWTSPYTITSSAINSWVGEELKTVGGELTAFYHTDDVEIGLTGALYGANDPAGTLLAWRGWSLNDRETGLLDRLRLAPVRIIQPTGSLSSRHRPRSLSTRSTAALGITSRFQPRISTMGNSPCSGTTTAPTTAPLKLDSGPGAPSSGPWATRSNYRKTSTSSPKP